MILLWRAGFIAVLALVTALFIRSGYRRDRVLGHLMLAGAVLYVAGVFVMGWYLHDVRGREYLAPDEIAFQIDGQRRLQAWRTGQDYVPILSGGYPVWNAAVIAVWGPSPLPLRLANAASGVVAIFAAYLLGYRLFRDAGAARLGAVLVLASPSLAIWTVNNVKERPLGMFVTLAMLAGVMLLDRWSVKRCLLFAVSIYVLAVMRHYYAGVLAWLAILLFAGFAAAPPWRTHTARVAGLVVALGCALLLGTGSFLAVALRGETVMRYVELPRERAEAEASPPRAGGAPETAATATSKPRGNRSASGRTIEEEIPLPSTDGLSLMGDTMGAGEVAGRRPILAVLESAWFVLFGRFEARGGAGRIMALVLLPEWLLGFLLLPLAAVAVASSPKGRRDAILLPAAFIATLVLLFAWTHGDDWTTLRFRSVYWPVLLVLAAGGFPLVWSRLRPRLAAAGLASAAPPPQP